MPDPAMTLTQIPGVDALGQDALALFGQDAFSTAGWYRSTAACALPAGTEAVFFVVRDRAGQVLAVFPMQLGADGLAALSTPYTCLWQPLLAAELRDGGDTRLIAIGRAFGGVCRRHGTVRLDAMDADWPAWPPLFEGMRSAGVRMLRFDHFGNWQIGVTGLSWDAYLAGRPGALREAIRRRGKRLLVEKAGRLRVIDGPEGLEPAIAAYEAVYAASWKQPEPFADFTADFMRACAADSSLRLGLLEVEGSAVAVQFWVVQRGWAGVLKLAHDERFRAQAPGTVLTGLMIRTMLEREGVDVIDFGRGDDAYKPSWTGRRRQRIGVIVADPRSVGGLVALARHRMGSVRKAVRRLWPGVRPS